MRWRQNLLNLMSVLLEEIIFQDRVVAPIQEGTRFDVVEKLSQVLLIGIPLRLDRGGNLWEALALSALLVAGLLEFLKAGLLSLNFELLLIWALR